jgi:hypothetical protein
MALLPKPLTSEEVAELVTLLRWLAAEGRAPRLVYRPGSPRATQQAVHDAHANAEALTLEALADRLEAPAH